MLVLIFTTWITHWGRVTTILYHIIIRGTLNIFLKTLHIQCKPDISRSRISRNWIYRGRMLDPIFWRPRARYFSRNRGNSLDLIRGRQFFAKSAHRDNLCSRFAGDNFSRNQLKPTCQCGLEHMLCDGQPRYAEHWHLHCEVERGRVNPLSM